MTQSRNRGKDFLIFVAILALLFLLVQLFRLPPQPARDIVFGELGRAPSVPTNRTEAVMAPRAAAESNEVTASRPPGGYTNTAPANSVETPQRIIHVPTSGPGEITPGPSPVEPTHTAMAEAVRAAMEAPPPGRSPYAPALVRPPQRSVPDEPPTLISGSAPPVSSRPSLAPYTPPPPAEPESKESSADLVASIKGYAPPALTPSGPKTTAALLGLDSNEAAIDAAPHRPATVAAGNLPGAPVETNVSFVVDQSLSMMKNGKTVRARSELVRMLQTLGPSETFYILFFHSGGYEAMPGFGPLPATPENISEITNWLFTVRHKFGSDPAKAVRRALRIVPAPDTVWLLSDGGFSTSAAKAIHEANETVNARINTVDLYSAEGAAVLRRISEENRGTFRFIPPP